MKYFYILLILTLTYACAEEEINDQKIQKKEQNNSKKSQKAKPIVKSNPNFIRQHDCEEKLLSYGEKNKEDEVIIHTEYGDMKIKLYHDTPLHRANFIMLNKLNFYDSTIFYRVMKGFMIQGGSNSEEDELGRPADKKTWSIGDYRIPAEFHEKYKHKRGAIAMANDSDIHIQNGKDPVYTSDPFQFYIVHQRQGAKHLDNRFTVFGEVVSGFHVLDKIANDPVEELANHYPLKPIKMWCEVVTPK